MSREIHPAQDRAIYHNLSSHFLEKFTFSAHSPSHTAQN